MTKKINSHNAFTLIEVMIAVMIISVVIMALLKMYANNTHIFLSYKDTTKLNQYSSFLIANTEYGYQNKNINMYDLVSEFDIRDELRRELKAIKVELQYKQLDKLGIGEADDLEGVQTADITLELGKSLLKVDISSSSFFRVRIQ